jgi:plasmid stabilization system protein ParE
VPRSIPVGFAESAVRDLEELQAWYIEQGAPEVSQPLAAGIFHRIEGLPDHPDMGRTVPEFKHPFLRELIHPPSRMDYRRDALRNRIVRVWRNERLLKLPREAFGPKAFGA